MFSTTQCTSLLECENTDTDAGFIPSLYDQTFTIADDTNNTERLNVVDINQSRIINLLNSAGAWLRRKLLFV